MSNEREKAIEEMELGLIKNFTAALNDPEVNAQMLNNARMFWTDLKKVKREEDQELTKELSGSLQSVARLMAAKDQPKED